MSSEEDPFSLLLAVAKHVRIDPAKNTNFTTSLASGKSEMEVLTNTLKSVSGIETSSLNISEIQQHHKQRQSSTTNGATTGSFFLDDSEDGQTVYRRASVYFSIVKSSRKFPGYFNPFEKRVIVNWYVRNQPFGSTVFYFFYFFILLNHELTNFSLLLLLTTYLTFPHALLLSGLKILLLVDLIHPTHISL